MKIFINWHIVSSKYGCLKLKCAISIELHKIIAIFLNTLFHWLDKQIVLPQTNVIVAVARLVMMLKQTYSNVLKARFKEINLQMAYL